MPSAERLGWSVWLLFVCLAFVVSSCEVGCFDDDDDDDISPPLDDDNDDQTPDDDASPGDDDASPADDDESPTDDDESPTDDDQSPDDDDDQSPADDDVDDDDDNDDDDDDNNDNNDNAPVGDTFACETDGVTTELLANGKLYPLAMTSDPTGKVYTLATRAGRLLLIEVETGQSTTIGMVACWAYAGALAADETGGLHLAYTDSRDYSLVYAVRQGKDWAKEDLGTGVAVGVGLDAAGKAHVLSAFDGETRLQTKAPGGSWASETLPDMGVGTFPVSLAVSATGAAHVLYQYISGAGEYYVEHQTNAGGSWTSSTLGPGYAYWPQTLRVDGDGRPHVFYLSMPIPRLRHAVLTQGSWDTHLIDAGALYVSSVAATMDLGGVFHVAYTDLADQQLRLATGDGGDWSVASIGDLADEQEVMFGFALDAAGDSFIGLKAPDATLRLWDNALNAWGWRTLLAGGEKGWSLSMGIGPAGDLHASFSDGVSSTDPQPFVHLGRVGGVWTRDTIVAGQTSRHSALAVGPDSAPHFVWFDEDALAVRHARLAGGVWTGETVYSGQYCNLGNMLAVDGDGGVHLAFETFHHLTYCTNADGGWACETVDDDVAEGAVAALAWKDTIGVRLVYVRQGESAFRYAWRLDDGWTSESTGAYGATDPNGSLPSMKIDRVGAAHFAHYAEYATNRSGAWTVVMVDEDEMYDVSLALDPSDGVHLTFANYTADELRYAAKIGGNWIHAVIHGAPSSGTLFNGENSQLEYGPDGLLHAAYLASQGVWHATFPPGYVNP